MLKVIEVGEKVRVIANGHTYSTHLRALRRLGVSKDRLPSLENGEEATVVGYTYIENRENDTFAYLIENSRGQKSVIGNEGVELIPRGDELFFHKGQFYRKEK